MPASDLFSVLRSRGWGYNSEQQLDVPFLAGNTTTRVTLVPATPYAGIIVHLITLHRFNPDQFQIRVYQEEVGDHTVVLTSDLAEVGFWAYVSQRAPLFLELTNLTAFAGFIGFTLATLNFTKLENMLQVKAVLEKETLLPLAELPSFVPRMPRIG